MTPDLDKLRADFELELVRHISYWADVDLSSAARALVAALEEKPKCTGPHSSAFDCPVHTPAHSVQPPEVAAGHQLAEANRRAHEEITALRASHEEMKRRVGRAIGYLGEPFMMHTLAKRDLLAILEGKETT